MFGRKMQVEYVDDAKKLYGDGLAYAHAGDAGLDLRITEDVDIDSGEVRVVGTGVKVAIPDGCVGLVFPRSGLATSRGLTLANAVGVIDSGYRGEIKATLWNIFPIEQHVDAGDRVCQLVVMPYCPVAITEGFIGEETERGTHGLGSTGVN